MLRFGAHREFQRVFSGSEEALSLEATCAGFWVGACGRAASPGPGGRGLTCLCWGALPEARQPG